MTVIRIPEGGEAPVLAASIPVGPRRIALPNTSERRPIVTDELQELPAEPGVYLVETASGTVHVISKIGRYTWERRPGPNSGPSRYDFYPVALMRLESGWRVGEQGSLTVSDETYLSGATCHLTATIVRITAEPQP